MGLPSESIFLSGKYLFKPPLGWSYKMFNLKSSLLMPTISKEYTFFIINLQMGNLTRADVAFNNFKNNIFCTPACFAEVSNATSWLNSPTLKTLPLIEYS